MTFENKKFLDKIGITHLWEKIENQFINGEELNVVIEAIDEVKADKTDLENYYNKTEIDSYELIAVEDIDEICNAVTEGSLESTDVDYLMAQLDFGVSTDELSPEEIEKLMNKLQ